MMFIKPLGLAITVFAFYLLAIIGSRVSLSFAEDKVSQEQED
jgi:hypothetical protein